MTKHLRQNFPNPRLGRYLGVKRAACTCPHLVIVEAGARLHLGLAHVDLDTVVGLLTDLRMDTQLKHNHAQLKHHHAR